MICYKDKVWCRENTCSLFDNGCHRSLTEQVIKDAEEFGLPTSVFMDRPGCFEEEDNNDVLEEKE